MSFEPPVSLWPDPDALGPVTDLYQLTMMAGYAAAGIDQSVATFELFVRKLPTNRSYLIFAGLEQAVGTLLDLRFSSDQIEAIRRWPVFDAIEPGWFDRLRDFRFTGDVWSIPEGSVVFANEPLLRVTAPLAQGQLVETILLSSLGYPTLVASKASRIIEAARGRSVVDFGARRGHGPHSGVPQRPGVVPRRFRRDEPRRGGSTVGDPGGRHDGSRLGPVVRQRAARLRDVRPAVPQGDDLARRHLRHRPGVRNAAAIEPPIQAIRIDSGDLVAASKSARAILDGLDRPGVKILVSNDLDETKIDDLLRDGAPIDAFGVGTELITSRDAPAISMVYKLVELDGVGRIKKSAGKRTYPMAKQVFRSSSADGQFLGDRVTRADESAEGEPLLVPVIRAGKRVGELPRLDAIRARCWSQRESLPDRFRRIEADASYPITYSDELEAEAIRLGLK